LRTPDHASPALIQPAWAFPAARLTQTPASLPRTAGGTACLTDKGHDFATQDDIVAHLADIRIHLDRRVRAAGRPDRIDQELQDDIHAFRNTEIGLATADLECGKATDRVIYDVTVEHEKRYLAEHRERLRRELPAATLPPGLAVYRDFSTGSGFTARYLR